MQNLGFKKRSEMRMETLWEEEEQQQEGHARLVGTEYAQSALYACLS